MKSKDSLLDQFQGCLMGLACGDALGLPFEFWRREKVQNYLESHELTMMSYRFGDSIYPAGFYSDDTALMICLAESLCEKGCDPDDQYARYRRWYLEGYGTPDGKCFGIGGHTLKVMLTQKRAPTELNHDEKAGGNGALMRCAPIGLFASGSQNEIDEISLRSCIVTHNNYVAVQCCTVLATCVDLLCRGTAKDELIGKLLFERLPNKLTALVINALTTVEAASPHDFSTSGYCLNTLRLALWGFLTTDSFEECIAKIIRQGGDTDTNAAVAGALAGSHYGFAAIPKLYHEKLLNRQYILKLAERLGRRYSK